MLGIYRLFFLPALLVMAPIYLRRMWRRGGYRGGFSQRFGRHPRLPRVAPGRHRLWLQAVSVGEMFAIQPLLHALHRDGVEVYLTTTTSTGFRIATDRYGGLTVGVGYFPIDWWPFVARAWRRIAPTLAIITEGERWPEHMRQAAKRRVPVLCVNARMSDASYQRMKTFPSAARFMLDGVTRLLPASAQDEARFRELGVPAERIVTTGNIKLDVSIKRLAEPERERLRRELGLPTGLLLLGSSTWPGEVEALLTAVRLTRERGVRCSLLIVPRHAERRLEIERLLQKEKWKYHFRSRGAAKEEVDVAVGDTTGELRNFTQLADAVFVGKSLPPHTEGQTPVEAAALGKPILFGPGMSNFRLIAQDLLGCGAAREVRDAAELAAAAQELFRDATQREKLSAAAAQWHRENSGAVERTLGVIREELKKL
jgi:3-deoxy-D-manno-octulosonic-acid transferase